MRKPTRLLQQMFSLTLIADAASAFLNARTSHAKTLAARIYFIRHDLSQVCRVYRS